DSYQSDLQASSDAPQAQAPPDALRPVAASPDAVESLHVRDVRNA
ncbi:hypothetical protein A2U01_0068264, partial [Trifolium medium]|nr:hypothetical protein [Trifolium medium]